MRILYVTPLWSGFGDILLDGAVNAKGMPAFINPLRRLIEQGHQVDFIIATKTQIDENDLNINVDWLKNSKFYFTDWDLSLTGRLKSPYPLYKIIQRLLKEQKYEFVYGHGSVGAIANIVANRNDIPFGIRLYGTFLAPEIDKYSPIKIFIKHPLEYLSFRLRKSFLLMTNDGTRGNEVYRYLISDKPSYNFHFWLNGFDNILNVDEHELNADILLNKPYIIYPARISRWKRQHLAVELLQELHKKGLNIHLYFAGHISETDYWDEVQKKVIDFDLNDYVHYLGTVEPAKLMTFDAAAFAVLSLYDLSNLGNVVIEALSIGALVISLNDGSLHGIINNGVNGVLVDNIEQAAKQISELVESSQVYQKLRYNAKKQAPNLFKTWDQRAEDEIQLIINAVKQFGK